MKLHNVISLFDGISCLQLALNKASIGYENYFASEIKKDAIKVTQHHFPNTIQLGDIRDVHYADGILYSNQDKFFIGTVDLVGGGQSLSRFFFCQHAL